LKRVKVAMEKPTKDLSDSEFEMLDQIGISAWDLIQANSGGHKCITNISGLNYLGRGKRPPQGPYRYDLKEKMLRILSSGRCYRMNSLEF
jgi:hypothetical protein